MLPISAEHQTMKDELKHRRIAASLLLPGAGYRYFFAYDTLMSEQNLKKICPDPKLVGIAYYESRRWLLNTSGKATITPRKVFRVYGTVWLIHDIDLAALDLYHGVPQEFDRFGALATLVDGRRCGAEFYATRGRPPAAEGASNVVPILQIARRLGFPPSYIEELSSWSKGTAGQNSQVRRSAQARET